MGSRGWEKRRTNELIGGQPGRAERGVYSEAAPHNLGKKKPHSERVRLDTHNATEGKDEQRDHAGPAGTMTALGTGGGGGGESRNSPPSPQHTQATKGRGERGRQGAQGERGRLEGEGGVGGPGVTAGAGKKLDRWREQLVYG